MTWALIDRIEKTCGILARVSNGKHQSEDLEDTDGAAILGRGEAHHKLQRDRHEDAPGPEVEDVKGEGRQQCQSPADLDGSRKSHRKTEQGEPEVLRVMPLRQVENRPQQGNTDKQERYHHPGDLLLIPVPGDGEVQPVATSAEIPASTRS